MRRVALLLFLSLAPGVGAHEVQTNRLTLVLRDQSHISLTFFLDYAGVLHRTLAPARPFQEFVVMYSAMTPAEFEKELRRAELRLQSGTHLSLPSGEIAIAGWKWPDPAKAQGLLREITMTALVAPADHSHQEPVEIRAEATAPRPIASIDVRLPAEMQDVLVVSYRPNQVMATPRAGVTRVVF
jgi:hypothetical protein